MTKKIWWCRRTGCGVQRETEVDARGFYNPPSGWLQLHVHGDNGERRVLANCCGEYCAWQFLLAMPVETRLTAPERNGNGKSWGCRECKTRYTSEFIRPGSLSLGEFTDAGRRWLGMFCDPSCAASYLEATLSKMLEAA